MSIPRTSPRVVRLRNDEPARRPQSPLAVLFLAAAATMAIQYLVLLALLLAAMRWNRQFGFQVGVGPLQFWQAHYANSLSAVPGVSYQFRSSASAEMGMGALLVSLLVGALAAVIQTKRVPA